MKATCELSAQKVMDGVSAIDKPSWTPRELIKAAARGLALLLATPALLSFWVRAQFLGRDRALEGSCQALSLLPGLWGQYVRRAFLSRVLARCHSSTCIGFGVLFSKTGTRLDEYVYLGPGCQIGLAHIERDALLASGVHVTSGAKTHGFAELDTPIREQAGEPTMVRIGAGAWIGSNAVVMADVGSHTIVGAGAVVTRPLPDRVIAAGVPARVIRPRDEVRTRNKES